jgi:hypothetical protein
MEDLNEVPSSLWNQTAFLSTNGPAGSVTNINSYRPAGNFGEIGDFGRNGHASYHSLQALFRSRLASFSTFQMSYTWSHSIGDVDLDNSSGSVNAEAFINPANTTLSRGNTNINRPQIFVANEVFYLPKLAGHSNLVQKTVGGWELNSIINVQSGASLSVYSNGASDANAAVNPEQIPGAGPCNSANMSNCYQLASLTGTGFGDPQRPDVTGVNCNVSGNSNQVLNPSAFTFVGYTLGTVGTAGRGICHGPNNRDVDLQLAKNWDFREHYRIKFSMDFFNLFNRANFYGNGLEGTNFNATNLSCGASACGPGNNVVTSQQANQNNNWGQATAVHAGRELQYTLRFEF